MINYCMVGLPSRIFNLEMRKKYTVARVYYKSRSSNTLSYRYNIIET
jgi:hypothetical protein